MATTTTRADADAATFESLRPTLFGVAYRMLGVAAEAEDVVQEAWLRWQTARPADVRSPRAYLVSIVTRLCLDVLKSARRTREQYPGPWLPEPVPTERLRAAAEPSPEETVAGLETLSYAFLVLLERLTPLERAVFLLRDVFDYDYAEIAETVGRTPAACRQHLHRARARLVEDRRRFETSYEERLRLTHEFVRAAGAGEMAPLVALLTEDVTLWSDGGGKRAAALNPIFGRDRVSRFVHGVAAKGMYDAVRLLDVNGQPAFLLSHHGSPMYLSIIEPVDGLIGAIHIVANPDKLGAVEALMS